MKKYKHKQTGKVVEQKDKIFVTSFDINSGKAQEIIPTWILENTNDWEEVFEKDYEILSLKYSGYIYNKVDKTKEDWQFYRDSKNYCLLSQAGKDICGLIEINSVKHLNDGEVFTIGDNVTSDFEVDGVQQINGFELWEDKLSIRLTKKEIKEFVCYRKIDKLKHTKPVLFTTEDGVDIFEDDEYYYLHKHSFHIDKAKAHKSFIDVNTTGIYFSTLKAAENYIKMNKPTLSLKEVLDGFDVSQGAYHRRKEYKKYLTKIVKEKI